MNKENDLIVNVRKYAEKHINSFLIDQRRCIPPHVVMTLANMGVLGFSVPKTYGGLELPYKVVKELIAQLAAIDVSIASLVGINNALGITPIAYDAKPSVKEELLPQLASGRILASFALTEPDSPGSFPLSIQSRANAVNDSEWVLNGRKKWTGLGHWSSITNVFAQTYDINGQLQGISAFVVSSSAKGYQSGKESLTLGLNGIPQNDLFLEDLNVGKAYLLGDLGKGLLVGQRAMMLGRLGIAAICLGVMKRSIQLMVEYTQKRNVSGGRLFDNAMTQVYISNSLTALQSLEALVDFVCESIDEGRPLSEDFYLVLKIIGPEFCFQVCDRLVQLMGGRGYVETNVASRLLRDCRLFRIFEGPTETLSRYLGSKYRAKASIKSIKLNFDHYDSPLFGDRLDWIIEETESRINQMKIDDQKKKNELLAMKLGDALSRLILLAVNERQKSQKTVISWLQHQLNVSVESNNAGAFGYQNSITPDSMWTQNELLKYTDHINLQIGALSCVVPGEDIDIDPYMRGAG